MLQQSAFTVNPRKCVVCPKSFVPSNSMIRHCSPRCGLKILALKAKAERTAFRHRKDAAKTPRELKGQAVSAFNAYIRYRDRLQTCIDCGKPFEPQKPGGTVDAGHFRSVGSAEHMRFIEDNVHSQRKNCNMPGGTSYDRYKAGLIERIGLERVAAVESDQTERHYKSDDFRRIRDIYKAKLKALKCE